GFERHDLGIPVADLKFNAPARAREHIRGRLPFKMNVVTDLSPAGNPLGDLPGRRIQGADAVKSNAFQGAGAAIMRLRAAPVYLPLALRGAPSCPGSDTVQGEGVIAYLNVRGELFQRRFGHSQ